jgi:hypothetical protein
MLPEDFERKRAEAKRLSDEQRAEFARRRSAIPPDASPAYKTTVATDGRWSVQCLQCRWKTHGRAHPSDATAVSDAAIGRHRAKRHPDAPSFVDDTE